MNTTLTDDTFPPGTFRECDPVLTAADLAANGNRKATTARLLKALAKHEGDSDLGQLAEAILKAGDFYMRNSREELEDAVTASEDVRGFADTLAEGWTQSAEYQIESMRADI